MSLISIFDVKAKNKKNECYIVKSFIEKADAENFMFKREYQYLSIGLSLFIEEN